MPVLLLEPYVFPANILTYPIDFLPDRAARWWVIQTRPRAEKSLARSLFGYETPFFLPLSRKCLNRRGRTVASYLPLFPSYVFLFGTNEQRIQSLTTNTTVHTLAVQDQQRLWTDLARLYQLMVAGASLVPEERLEPGTWVEITAGPLFGMKGRIIRRANHLRFVVDIDFLQRGASVEVDEAMITPADPIGRPIRMCA